MDTWAVSTVPDSVPKRTTYRLTNYLLLTVPQRRIPIPMRIDMHSRLLTFPLRFMRRKRHTIGIGRIIISIPDLGSKVDMRDDRMEG